tara:strand:+ start:148 stop:477 length:330 start_codon:yes stop_codon:yes gene_type:complete
MSRKYKVRGAVTDVFSFEVDDNLYNWTAVASFYSDAAFTTPAEATAGTVIVSGKIPGAQGTVSFTHSPFPASNTSKYASLSVPLESISVSLANVTGATHVKITVTGTAG